MSQIAISGFLSTSNPSVSDDGTLGHYVFERWYNTTSGSEFVCKSAATGAAVWVAVGGVTVTDWASEATTIGASTTPPTKGTVLRDKIYWRRVGDSMEIRIDFKQSAAGSAGSGTYLWALPAGAGGVTIDNTKVAFITTAGLFAGMVGSAWVSDEASATRVFMATAYDTTHFKLVDGTVGDNGSAYGALNFGSTIVNYSIIVSLPITEWA